MRADKIKRVSILALMLITVFMVSACGKSGEAAAGKADDDSQSTESVENKMQEEGNVTEDQMQIAMENADIVGAKDKMNKLAADAGLDPLSADIMLMPIGSYVPTETSASLNDGAVTFTYSQGDTEVKYVIDLNSEKVQRGLVEVATSHNGGDLIPAVTDAGTGYLTKKGKTVSAKKFAEGAQVAMDAEFDDKSGHLILNYTDTVDGVENQKQYDYFMCGKTLVVQVTSSSINGNNGYSSFTSGTTGKIDNPRMDTCIYCEEVGIGILEDSYFVSCFLDKAKSFGTRISNAAGVSKNGITYGMTSYYDVNSKGETNPLNELLYITVSDDFMDCAYDNNASKSEYRDMLNDLVVYDNWQFTNTYSARMYNAKDLHENYALDDILYVEHRWQRDQLDQSNPAFFPASTHWGSADEFQNYITTIKENGWKLALHEDYWFITPSKTNQYWNVEGVEERIAQDAQGNLRLGWQDWSYANKSDMMTYYAEIESTQIKDAYDPDADFLDVSGGVDPSIMNQITLNGDSTTSRTLAQVVADTVSLFEQSKGIYEGPIISEGAQGARAFGSAYAGFLESGSREITDCNRCRIMPDYELKKVRYKMVNEGMGPPARFQAVDKIEDYDFDKYNATALAYGHTGFIGDTHYSTPLLIDEIINVYYTFRAVQPQYLDTNADVTEISYFDKNNAPMDLNQAVLSGYDFTKAHLYIKYSNGLEMYFNFDSDVWDVVINDHDYQLDENGYAAENPNEDFVMYSCLNEGNRVDYVKSKLYTYANPRGSLTDFGEGLIANQLYISTADGFVKNTETPVKEDPVYFTKLVGEENGENGLTFYYTADGVNLTPFTERSTEEPGWKHGDEGVLVYPVIVASDNYGVAGTSEKEYVVMGYKVPKTGAMDVHLWTVLQGPSGNHGYKVKVATGTPDNVIHQFDLVGDTQLATDNTLSVKVTKDEELYIIYEPIVKKNNEWFGYTTDLAYTFTEGE